MSRMSMLNVTKLRRYCHALPGLAAARLDCHRDVRRYRYANASRLTGFRQRQMSKRPSDDPLAIMFSSRDEIVWNWSEQAASFMWEDSLQAFVLCNLPFRGRALAPARSRSY